MNRSWSIFSAGAIRRTFAWTALTMTPLFRQALTTSPPLVNRPLYACVSSSNAYVEAFTAYLS